MLRSIHSSEVFLNPTHQSEGKMARLGRLAGTAARVAMVAAVAIAFAAAGAAIALSFGLDLVAVVAIAAAAGVVGLILGLFLNRLLGKKSDEWQSIAPPAKTFASYREELQKDFIRAQEKKIEKLVTVLDLPQAPKLTNAQLDEVLELVDDAKSSLTAQYQIEKLQNRLIAELGDEEKANQVFQNDELYPAELKKEGAVPSDAMIEHIVGKASNYFNNLAGLARLRKEIDPKILERVLSQLGLKTALQNGQYRLTGETEQAILASAKAIRAAENFDHLIEQVKESAKRDLFLDDQFIEKKFHVSEKLQDLPEDDRQHRRDQLQGVINEAYIARELNKRGKISTGDKEEVELLGYLGCSVDEKSKYFDKDSVYILVREIIHNQLRNENCIQPLPYVKEIIKTCAMRARLRSAGISEELQMEKFQISHALLKETKAAILIQQQQCALILPRDFPLAEDSLNLKKIKREFELLKEKEITNVILKGMFEDPRLNRGFKETAVTTLQFQNYLNNPRFRKCYLETEFLMSQWQNIQSHQYIQDRIAFFQKWGPYLKAELIQGLDDPNECLLEGVCWGIIQRLRLIALENPKITLEEFIKEIRIKPEDRFLQGVHTMDGRMQLPSKMLQEKGFYEDQRILEVREEADQGFNREMQRQLPIKIKREANHLYTANGWAPVELQMKESAHATIMRLNWVNSDSPHQAWFADPNFGLFCFEEGHTFEEARDLCCQFINDLIRVNYPTTFWVRAFKLA